MCLILVPFTADPPRLRLALTRFFRPLNAKVTSCSLASARGCRQESARRRLLRLLGTTAPWPPESDQPDRGEMGRVTNTLRVRLHSQHPGAEGADLWLNPRSTSLG